MKRICFLFWLGLCGLSYSETRYVVKDNPGAAAPYTSWATAAATIQAAVDAANNGDTVLVTNGVYDTGGLPNYPAGQTRSNRVAIYKPVIVRSVNGADVTTVMGDSGIRCVYLAEGASLEGFTLSNGSAPYADGDPIGNYTGGGIWCEGTNAVVANCVITASFAVWGGGAYHGTINNSSFVNNSGNGGGGAYECTLNNCTLSDNSASSAGRGGAIYGGTAYNCVLLRNQVWGQVPAGGGGAFGATLYNCAVISNYANGYKYGTSGGGVNQCTLYNCTVVGNSINPGFSGCSGGADGSTLYNCILWDNVGGNFHGGTFQNSCTFPDPGGVGNITNDPQFVDAANGDYRLQTNSPCINMGINQDWMIGARDLDGNPRFCGRVDMGAFEYHRRPPYRPNNDFDGDNRADLGVLRPSTVTWYIFQSALGSKAPFTYGARGDINVSADYDGDGLADFAVLRPSTMTWYIFQSSLGPKDPFVFGAPGDIPVPADYDGDGLADFAVLRPSTMTWYLWQSKLGPKDAFVFGALGDIPVPADYDGDGLADFGVLRPSTMKWYLWQSTLGPKAEFTYGAPGDLPIPADYDGDGLADISVMRPSTMTWYIFQSTLLPKAPFKYGASGDTPLR